MPYIGSDAPIEIQVPDKYMKLDNPKRANIMALMKDKLNQLESLNRELMCKIDVKSRYHQIKELMANVNTMKLKETSFVWEMNVLSIRCKSQIVKRKLINY